MPKKKKRKILVGYTNEDWTMKKIGMNEEVWHNAIRKKGHAITFGGEVNVRITMEEI